jgi:hypothetical protein
MKAVSVISAVVLVVGVFPMTVSAATLFSDSFETGNFSSWTSNDNDWSVTSGSGHDGSKKASVSDQGASDDMLQKDVSTAGYESVVLSYYYKTAQPLESSDHVRVEWYNGSTWIEVADYFSINNGSWTAATHNLAAGASNLASFKIRFRASGLEDNNGGGDKDEFLLDLVTLSGSALVIDTDADDDGVNDDVDNCVNNANADQLDSDGDTIGDECDDTPFTEEQLCAQEGGFWNGSECEEIPECSEGEAYNSETNECDEVVVPPTDEELCEAQEGMSWNGEECVEDEAPPTDEEICVEAGNNWIDGECYTDEEVCIDAGDHWIDGECIADSIICDVFEQLNIPMPEQCEEEPTEEDLCEAQEGMIWNGEECVEDEVPPTDEELCEVQEGMSWIDGQCVSDENVEENNQPEVESNNGGNGGSRGHIDPMCHNNEDDDNDGLYDVNDPDCENASDNSESPSGEVLGESTASCVATITEYMRMGQTNNPEQVKLLQEFLNTELGLELEVSGEFDRPTLDAVKEFQIKYSEEVLTPWGIFDSTGYAYKTTLRMIQMIMCPGTDIPMPELN